jgi:hypothetical protein
MKDKRGQQKGRNTFGALSDAMESAATVSEIVLEAAAA